MLSADAEQTSEGKFEVTMTVAAAKFEADGAGRETEGAVNEYVDIALFSGDPEDVSGDTKVLYNQKHKLVSGENTFTVTVEEKPAYVGVDPFVKMIDRDSGDNVIQL